MASGPLMAPSMALDRPGLDALDFELDLDTAAALESILCPWAQPAARAELLQAGYQGAAEGSASCLRRQTGSLQRASNARLPSTCGTPKDLEASCSENAMEGLELCNLDSLLLQHELLELVKLQQKMQTGSTALAPRCQAEDMSLQVLPALDMVPALEEAMPSLAPDLDSLMRLGEQADGHGTASPTSSMMAASSPSQAAPTATDQVPVPAPNPAPAEVPGLAPAPGPALASASATDLNPVRGPAQTSHRANACQVSQLGQDVARCTQGALQTDAFRRPDADKGRGLCSPEAAAPPILVQPAPNWTHQRTSQAPRVPLKRSWLGSPRAASVKISHAISPACRSETPRQKTEALGSHGISQACHPVTPQQKMAAMGSHGISQAEDAHPPQPKQSGGVDLKPIPCLRQVSSMQQEQTRWHTQGQDARLRPVQSVPAAWGGVELRHTGQGTQRLDQHGPATDAAGPLLTHLSSLASSVPLCSVPEDSGTDFPVKRRRLRSPRPVPSASLAQPPIFPLLSRLPESLPIVGPSGAEGLSGKGGHCEDGMAACPRSASGMAVPGPGQESHRTHQAPQAQKRATFERLRRERIRYGLNELRKAVGATGDTATVLQQAVDYIHYLEAEVMTLQLQVDDQ